MQCLCREKIAFGTVNATYRVVLAFRQHIGAPSVPCVMDGDVVKKGDKIAEAAEGLSLPQYASISGRAMVFDGEKIVIERVSE